MAKTGNILLAALGGAVVAGLIANYLQTEQGRQLLNNATDTLKDLSGKATDYAKNNLSQVLNETKSGVADVVKEKVSQHLTQNKPA